MDTQLNLIEIPGDPDPGEADAASDQGPHGTRRARQANGGTPRGTGANPPRIGRRGSTVRISEEARATGRRGIASAREALAAARRRPADGDDVARQHPSAA